jgi:hypothetical protein
MAVLVNSGSASASEIVAGALQDWGRARLVGERTYGKGSVQSLIPLDATGGRTKLRLTIARYFLPSGVSIDSRGAEEGGVAPDVEVEDAALSGWESEEIARLGLAEKIDEHVRGTFADNEARFEELAVSDGGRLEAYPGLAAMIAGVLGEPGEWRISEDSLRRIARASVRRRLADARGREFVFDLEDDRVLRRGVYELLARREDTADLPPVCREILDEFAPAPADRASLPAEAAPAAR